MIQERKVNILSCGKVFPCAPAPKKERRFYPHGEIQGFYAAEVISTLMS